MGINKLKIRKARISDLTEAAKIFIKEYSASPYDERWSRSRAFKKLRRYFDNSDFFLLTINGEIKGFAIVTRIIWDWGNLAFGEELAISKEEQRKGYGKAMIALLEEYYRKRGFKKFSLAANKKSQAYILYKKLGYKIKKYGADGEKDMMKNKSAQFKIQQMAFMLLGVVLFFILVGLFWLSLKSSGLNKSSAGLAQESAVALALTISNSPELSCGSQCIDMDKALILKGTRIFESLWPIKALQIRKIYPLSTREVTECTASNYPECSIITIINSNGESKGEASSFVKLCHKEKNSEGYTYDKCDLGEVVVKT